MQQYTSPLAVNERDPSVVPDSALAEPRPTLCDKDSIVDSKLVRVAPPDSAVDAIGECCFQLLFFPAVRETSGLAPVLTDN